MSQKLANFLVNCVIFIMNSHQLFNHGRFKSFVIHRYFLLYSNPSQKASAISYRPEHFIFNKSNYFWNPWKGLWDTLGSRLLMALLEQHWDCTTKLSKDFQNSSREANGFIKWLTQNQAEKELITWDWMNWWRMITILWWLLFATLLVL